MESAIFLALIIIAVVILKVAAIAKRWRLKQMTQPWYFIHVYSQQSIK